MRAQSPAQNPSKTSKIAAITVVGARKFPADQIILATGLKTGDVVSAEQIQAGADRLAALGVFSTVNYHFTSKDETISLEFQVQEAPTVPLLFDNFPWFTDDEIIAAIRHDVGMFAGEAPEGGAMIDEIAVALDKLLSSRHVRGTLTHQLVARPVGDGNVMLFRNEGPSLKVQTVQFGESLATDSEQLKDRVPDIMGQTYSRFAIDVFENEHVRPVYGSKGFLRAQIGPPQTHLTGPTDESGGSGVDVLIPITPGPVYSWIGASWRGNSAIPSTALDAMVQMKPGDIADEMKIEGMWRNIESQYASQGYLDAKVDAEPQFDDAAHKVSYHVSIEEGPQYHMGEMVVTGLSLDAEKLLRHAWQIAPGQIFDGDYFENLLKVLAKPSATIFGETPVHYTQFGHFLRPSPDRRTVDVLLDFK